MNTTRRLLVAVAMLALLLPACGDGTSKSGKLTSEQEELMENPQVLQQAGEFFLRRIFEGKADRAYEDQASKSFKKNVSYAEFKKFVEKNPALTSHASYEVKVGARE